MSQKVEVVVSAINQTQIAFTSLQQALKEAQSEINQMAGKAEETSRRTRSATEQIGMSWKTMTTAMAGGNLIAIGIEKVVEKLNELKAKIDEVARYAARVETLGIAMNVAGNNAGYTSAQMTVFENQVKSMGITTESSREALVKMSSSQMDLSKSAQLARVAQDAAVVGNINSSEAFGRMIQGIRSGEVEILRNIGISVQFEAGYKKMAATLGKTTESLTDQEKVQSRVNQVLEEGAKMQGIYDAAMGTTGKQLTSITRYTDELKLAFGGAFSPALGVMVEETTNKLKALLKHFEENRAAYKEFAQNLADIIKSAAHPIDAMSRTIYGAFGDENNPVAEREASEAESKRKTEEVNKEYTAAKERQRIRQSESEAKRRAREAEAAADKKAMDEAEGQYQQYLNWFYSTKNKTADNAPEQDAFLKSLRDIDDEIEKQVRALPQYAKSIREVGNELRNSLIKKNERDIAADWQKNPFQYQTIEQYNKELASTRALELEINLARIDAEEKSLSITSGEAAKQRIAALQEPLEIKKAKYEVESNDTEVTQVKKLELLKEIGQVERQIADNRETLLNSGNNFFGGYGRGLHDLSIQQKGFYEQGRDMARQTASAMQSAMADGFFDIMQGKFNNLGKVIENFLLSIQRMIANFFAQQATQALINSFGSALGFGMGAGGGQAAAGGGSAGSAYRSNGWNNTGAASVVMHNGGLVPRFHFGGLAADEVPAILQTGERVLDREHNALLERFANKAGGSGNVQINMINQSGQQLDVEQQGQPRFDGAQMIVDVVVKRLRSDPGFRSAMATGGAY